MKCNIGWMNMIFRITLGIMVIFFREFTLKTGGVLLVSSLY